MDNMLDDLTSMIGRLNEKEREMLLEAAVEAALIAKAADAFSELSGDCAHEQPKRALDPEKSQLSPHHSFDRD